MERLQRVQVVRRTHPHFEEYGRFTGKVIRPVWAPSDGTGDMAEVALEHCRHGTDACFVSKGDVKVVAERDASAPRRARRQRQPRIEVIS